MKKLIFLILVLLSTFSFGSKDFKFDENRIMKVFSEYELVNSRSGDNVYLHFLDRENEIKVEISTYRRGDTEAAARIRFADVAKRANFEKISSNPLTKNYLGVDSVSYFKKTIYGPRNSEDIFLNGLKVAVEYSGGNPDYEKALTLLREALDPTISLKNRTRKTYSQNYSIDNFVDKNKLVNNFRDKYRTVRFEEEEGNPYDRSAYRIYIDEDTAVRGVFIESNNNFSEKVILRRWENYLLSQAERDSNGVSHPYVYKENETNLSRRYFGVNARTYTNEYMKNELGINLVGVFRHIVTEKYTITTFTYLENDDKKEELEEYERFLSIIKSSLR